MIEAACNSLLPSGHCVFPTAIGFIALAWTRAGFACLQLPASDRESTRRRLLKGSGDRASDFPELSDGSRPGLVSEVIERVQRYTNGECAEFLDIPFDMTGIDPFRCAIYRAARNLAYGETTTYGGLAADAGYPGMARETGQALGANPLTIIVPCHRILASGGKIGGFSAYGGIATKRKLLAMENARFSEPDAAQQSFCF